MTGREKLDAEERKQRMYSAQGCKCAICGKQLRYSEAQAAHRIPKTKVYLEKYGKKIIHHSWNMMITCAACNSAVLIDPKTHPLEAAELIAQIQTDIGA